MSAATLSVPYPKPVFWMDHFDPEKVHLGTIRVYPLTSTFRAGQKITSNCCSMHIDDCHDLFGPDVVDLLKEAGPGKMLFMEEFEVEVEND